MNYKCEVLESKYSFASTGGPPPDKEDGGLSVIGIAISFFLGWLIAFGAVLIQGGVL